MTYFTLQALAAEWDDLLVGAAVVDAWTQSANELSIALERENDQHTIRIHCNPKMPLLFRMDGFGRARKNSVALFGEVRGTRLEAVRTAVRDRFVFVDLDDGSSLQIQLFGSRPNVFHVQGGEVREAFLMNEEWVGKTAPQSRPAPMLATADEFLGRWKSDRKTLVQAVSGTLPLFDRCLAEEAIFRAELDPDLSPTCISDESLGVLFAVCHRLVEDLDSPQPTVYWRGAFAESFSLVPLCSAPEEWRAESFESVDGALSVLAKRSLAQRRFLEVYKPVDSALSRAARKLVRRADSMLSELQNASRADDYEAWAHLLMAQAADQSAGHERVSLPNILGDGSDITIALDPALTAIENAQRYYGKARQTRESRRHAEERWASVQVEAETARELLEELHAVARIADLESFLNDKKAALAPFVHPDAVGADNLPYRRYEVSGWEIRVGKNAKSNAALTTKHSGPHDLWLHARGVPGSHVIIRRPNKATEAPKPVVESAARIAAHFSNAKSQPLAPVIVTERKYVRPVKGGAPGLVRVDREDVIMVQPGLPTG